MEGVSIEYPMHYGATPSQIIRLLLILNMYLN
jgi:hypothetical protein